MYHLAGKTWQMDYGLYPFPLSSTFYPTLIKNLPAHASQSLIYIKDGTYRGEFNFRSTRSGSMSVATDTLARARSDSMVSWPTWDPHVRAQTFL